MSFTVLAVTSLLCVVHAFPSGPPIVDNPRVCETMMPSHGANAMTNTAPYEIKVSDTCYSAGARLKGLIVGLMWLSVTVVVSAT